MLYQLLAYCRAKWARPTCLSFSHSCSVSCGCFFSQAGDFASAEASRGLCGRPRHPFAVHNSMLDFYRCRGNRACGRDQRAFRSPSGLLRLPCGLIFIVAGDFAPAGASRGLCGRPRHPFAFALPCCLTFIAARKSHLPAPSLSGKKFPKCAFPPCAKRKSMLQYARIEAFERAGASALTQENVFVNDPDDELRKEDFSYAVRLL